MASCQMFRSECLCMRVVNSMFETVNSRQMASVHVRETRVTWPVSPMVTNTPSHCVVKLSSKSLCASVSTNPLQIAPPHLLRAIIRSLGDVTGAIRDIFTPLICSADGVNMLLGMARTSISSICRYQKVRPVCRESMLLGMTRTSISQAPSCLQGVLQARTLGVSG